MKANFPDSLQHMQKELVSKETGIFRMSSMWSEMGKGWKDRACLPTWPLPPSLPPRQAQSIPNTPHGIPGGHIRLERRAGAAAGSNSQQQLSTQYWGACFNLEKSEMGSYHLCIACKC